MTYMACCVDPGVVEGARDATGLLIDLLQNLDFLVEAFEFVVDGHDGRKDGDGACLVGPANIVEIFLASKLFELSGHCIARLLSVLARVLLSKALDSHFFLVCLKLLREHLE